jgi:hypothetical protein
MKENMKESMKATERIYRWSSALLGRMESSSAFSIFPHSALQTLAFSLHFISTPLLKLFALFKLLLFL